MTNALTLESYKQLNKCKLYLLDSKGAGLIQQCKMSKLCFV